LQDKLLRLDALALRHDFQSLRKGRNSRVFKRIWCCLVVG